MAAALKLATWSLEQQSACVRRATPYGGLGILQLPIVAVLDSNGIDVTPVFYPAETGIRSSLSLTPFLDQSEPEFSPRRTHGGLVADERLASAAGVS